MDRARILITLREDVVLHQFNCCVVNGIVSTLSIGFKQVNNQLSYSFTLKEGEEDWFD